MMISKKKKLKKNMNGTKIKKADAEWPFPPNIYDGDLNSPSAAATEKWQGVAPSTAMQWTVKELMKDVKPLNAN